MNVCLWQEHDCEAGFIAIVLQTLIAQVKCELADIHQLETLRVEYLGVQMQLGHWLTERPSVVELKVVRQTIKGLKSRLRHTLADKQDAEEVSGRGREGRKRGRGGRVIKGLKSRLRHTLADKQDAEEVSGRGGGAGGVNERGGDGG